MKIVITGASSGIGNAIAKKYLSLGEDVINIDLIKNKEIKTFVADISNIKELEKISKEVGKFDILICDAGVQDIKPLKDTTSEDFKKIVDINLCGTFNTIKAFSKNLKDGGSILNVTSVHSMKPRLNKFAYDSAKAGINILTKELALEFAPRKINVNAIALGATDTPMNSEMKKNKKLLKEAISNIPFGKMAQPEEVSEAIVSLLSSSFKYMTGSIITFDGGRLLK